MNTNTVEQAGRLKELGISSNISLAETRGVKGGNIPILIIPGLNSKYHEEKGPALTLDDLHKVFELLDDNYGKLWPTPTVPAPFIRSWNVRMQLFNRTSNHAEDWTAILIWLLENNHVTAQAVNEALE